MSANLQKCLKELRELSSRESKKRRQQLKLLSKKKCVYLALKEIATNLINKKLKIPPSEYKKFYKHAKVIKALAKGKGSKQTKQKYVKQSGGFIAAILPHLLTLFAPLIAQTVNAALT
jgi:hypothetical protein